MKYDRYSKVAFDAHGLDTAEAQRLADQLAYDALIEVTRAASNRLAEIVGELNQRGHQLVRYEAQPGDIDYRDQVHADPCALRLGVFVSMAAGYAHVQDAEGNAVQARASWGGSGSPGSNRDGG